MNEQEILNLKERIKELESQVVDLQSQQLETGNNIVTLIQHAETMNNVTDASGLLAEHVTDLEERLNIVVNWMKEEIRLRGLN
ncbi:hypothetical protein OAP03_02915 [Gammaproteobacteria bacterium]|nr:hypothetical protein [Gammaproteobacteria bacterium]MDC0577238.1 hypothetical protein [Gammaproteobacteria bacterium]|tara:strand:- start:534 stop:782 length:249 start_codon:yes stop_codon:yes gene_type:complete